MTKKQRVVAGAILSLTLVAHAISLPVGAHDLGLGVETFYGTATGRMGAAGAFKIVSSRATECAGTLKWETKSKGSGTILCTDGRTGIFTFVSVGDLGFTDGTLGGKPLSFSFGWYD